MSSYIHATYDKNFSKDQLQWKLTDNESAAGKIVKIDTGEVDQQQVTVSRHETVPASEKLPEIVVIGEDEIPSDKSPDIPGTAYIEGEKKIIVIYR